MAFVLPLVAFLCGLWLANVSFHRALKKHLSSLLARLLIPSVIIYNMVFYQSGGINLMLFSFVVAVIIFYTSSSIFKDDLQALSLSYVNLAWLGFPFALALFGTQSSAAMVALYIGGSIFGNIWAVLVLSPRQGYRDICLKVLKSPPIIALGIAVVVRALGMQHWAEKQLLDLGYHIVKDVMIFAGMCVLGMWLRHTKIHQQDLKHSAYLASYKLLIGIIICSLSYFYIEIVEFKQYIGLMLLLFLLPPAANIVALETHYKGTGQSARYIASGTVISCVLIFTYAMLLHL